MILSCVSCGLQS